MRPHNESHTVFTSEIASHKNTLLSYAMRLTGSYTDAQDLVQETLLKAFKHIEHYQKGSNAKAWLTTILRNSFISEVRAQKYINKEYESLEVCQEKASVCNQSGIDLESFSDETLSALSALPADLRLVLILCDVQGYKVDEVAQLLSIRGGTIRTRLHYARLQMRRCLLKAA